MSLDINEIWMWGYPTIIFFTLILLVKSLYELIMIKGGSTNELLSKLVKVESLKSQRAKTIDIYEEIAITS
mgnify:FL=1